MRDDEPSGFGFGRHGRRPGGSRRWKPTVLTWILLANIAVFAIQWMGIAWWQHGPDGSGPKGYVSRDTLANGQFWTLFTHMFVHGGPFHIAVNLILIWATGRVVLHVIGPRHFLALYFLGGLVGAGAQMAISPSPLVGASGAAFAVLVAFGMILWDTQIFALLAFVFPVRLRARMLVLGVVVVTVVFAVIDLLTEDNHDGLIPPIAHMAHLGGALVGYYYAKSLRFPGKMLTRQDLLRQREERVEGEEWKYASRPDEGRSWKPKTRRHPERQKVVEAEVVESEDFISKEIDPILDKIKEHGMQSLTKAERKILDKGSKKIASKVD